MLIVEMLRVSWGCNPPEQLRGCVFLFKELKMQTVKAGQIWADNDKRRKGRTIIVRSLLNGRAHCEVLTQAPGRFIKKKFTKIKLERFRPRANGYTLYEDVKSLSQRCGEKILNNWDKINDSVVRTTLITTSVTVREFKGGYNINAQINGTSVCNVVYRGDLDGALEKMKTSLSDISTDLEMLCCGF